MDTKKVNYKDKFEFTNKTILDLTEADKRYGEIYVITCLENNKKYIGQAISHKLNHDKYRLHGSLGRFKNHLCEALQNTRKDGGSAYLNQAIRKYGKDKFKVEVILQCEYKDIDFFEKHYIKEYNSLSPNGYNLTNGGKTEFKWYNEKKIKREEIGINDPIKRGRDFGFTHKEETKAKMKQFYEENKNNKEFKDKKENTMRNSMSSYYNQKRVQKLLDYDLDSNHESHIHKSFDSQGNLVNYFIYAKRGKTFKLENKDLSLDKRYEILLQNLKDAYELKQKNKKDVKEKNK